MRIPVLDTTEPSEPEGGAWSTVREGWKLLYGSFSAGVALEWHEFQSSAAIDWGMSFHPGSVELCLNQSGRGVVKSGKDIARFGPATAGVYGAADLAVSGTREAKELHRFITLEMQPDFLAAQLSDDTSVLPSAVQRFVERRSRQGFVGPVFPLTAAQTALVERLATPPVSSAAMPLWYQGKICELIAEFVFAPPQELFCTRQRRLARERVERVCEIVRNRLENPPSLEELGREVGVSQFYLSRTFSQEMRMTIPQYLRRIRMERAAELLRGGRHNVTEAAFAVGYSSLGHFSKSFCEVMGCCPTLYPQAKVLARR